MRFAMKRLLLFLLPALLLSACAISMYGTHPLLTQEQKEIIIPHQIEKDKKEIRNKTLMFISESYGSAKAVIEVNEEDILSGSGNMIINHHAMALGGAVDTKIDFKFIIKFADSEIRTKYIFADKMYNDAGSGNPYIYNPTEYGYYGDRIIPAFKSLDSLMYNYIIADNDF
jgi:cell division protein FtsL